MNRYLMISRLRWPALLLLTGVIALLVNFDKLEWSQAWPLYLILLGVLALAERASLASQPPPENPYPGYPAGYPIGYQGQPTGGYPPPAGGYAGSPATSAAPSTSIVPSHDEANLRIRLNVGKPSGETEEEGR